MKTGVGARRMMARLAVAMLFTAVATACSDGLFVSPARTPAGLGLSFSLVGGLSADVTAAFNAADQVRVSVSGPGVSIVDRSFAISPADESETRVAVEIEGAQSGATYQVTVRLLDDGQILFESSFNTQVNAGQTTPVNVLLTPVAATLVPAQPAMLVLVLGQPVPILVQSLFATGDTIPQGAIVIDWSSSNTGVATVNSSGIVTPIADGQTVITARSGAAQANTTVTVLETPARNVRVCPTSAPPMRTYATLAMALDSVASGGTVRLCSGTFIANDLVISKPVTIEAEGGANVTLRPDVAAIALVLGHPTGLVTIRNVNVLGAPQQAIVGSANGVYGDVLVENVVVTNAANAHSGLFFGANSNTTSRVTLRNITVTGGQTGVFVANGAHVDVSDSQFAGQSVSNIQYQMNVRGEILRNTVAECGQFGCIRVRFAGDVLIADNTVRSSSRSGEFPNGVLHGIAADGQNVRVAGNLVEGIGTITDPSNPETYPFRGAGLAVLNASSGGATFTDNVVRNAAVGMYVEGPTGTGPHLTGSDNVLQNTQTAVAAFGSGTMSLHRSDITNYAVPMFSGGGAAGLSDGGAIILRPELSALLQPGSLTCNWWGSASGPTNASNFDPSIYSPFATQPIANTSVVCPPVGTSTLSGAVVNASTSQPVAGAVIELRQGGSVVASATSGSGGGYSFGQLSAGTYTVHITAPGFAAFSSNIVIGSNEAVSRTFAIVPSVSDDQIRIVLTWAASPVDLDSHLEVPAFENNPVTFVFFGNPGSSTEYPFATLDVDDVDGFGPETIAIAQQLTGTYRFYVHNFSEETALSASGAAVEVYRGNTRIATFNVPNGTGDLWTVFSLNGQTLTPINTMGTMNSVRAADVANGLISK